MWCVLKSIRTVLFGVARDQRGSLATFIAAAVVPLVAFGGLSIDTARGYLMKTRLNYALDAAALAGGRVMFDATERDAAIDSFFKANFPDGFMGATITGPTPTINVQEQTLKLDASANLGTSLMRVVGIDDMEVAASAEVQRQIKGMELAMVLDITGSMRYTAPGSSQDKLDDLRDAAEKLVDILYAGREEIDDFYMSVVPYTAAVNIGNAHTAWLHPFVPKPGENENNDTPYPHGVPIGYMDGSYDHSKWKDSYHPSVWKGCVEARFSNDRDLADDPPSVELFYPFRWPSDYGESVTHSNEWTTWNINETNGDSGRGPNLNCGNPVVPLVKARSTIDTSLAGLKHWRYGGTMGNQGIAWGWRTISPRWRGLWSGAESSDLPKDYIDDLLANSLPLSDKAVVMMTDGYNNITYHTNQLDDGNYTSFGKPDWNRLGVTNNNSLQDEAIKNEINARMIQTCNLMKDEGIIIYTITFDTEGSAYADIRDLYEACATTPQHYYNSPGEEQLTAAFIAIGTQLSNLRLAK